MLFDLVNRYPKRIILDWQRPPAELSRKYQSLGWKRGDALVASHIEHLGAPVLVSENRDFLTAISDLPFRILTASALLTELGEPER